MPPPHDAFKGNKSSLPSKPCQACGRPMTWRKAWARNWDDVKYCSERCRRDKSTRSTAHG
ncbi:DUF2256 domain-containing protein [Roseateles puraquae]|jgi:hypothetical protein|uniref:DUF2256 domain-containing protein n=1 Tax=Roseateles puraquae TaxID=431059 RepID=A0A254N3S4_9BURK|nr:DUF2256 domain-containing protein [Roseateles puraquae]MDG0855547.1 DUF2256 domain-containing protein [Roseateles puraquae]OWR02324.1 hypothetical protein CDO81_19185 [Roseateles puraquae]